MSEVVFIGTSDAFGAGGRRQSAILVRGPSGAALLDCGTTTSTGLNALGISRDEIDTIAISHFHGDHFGGIPIVLLAALYEDNRTHPLRIVGPPGIERQVREIAEAMCYGIDDREWTFPILFQEFAPGQDVDAGPLRLRAFETLHQPHTHPHGFVTHLGGEQIAYSGDTGWFPELPRHVGESDLFICECTYHSFGFEYHISHEGLVEHRDDLHCGRIILTHLGAEMTDRRGKLDFATADDGTVLKL